MIESRHQSPRVLVVNRKYLSICTLAVGCLWIGFIPYGPTRSVCGCQERDELYFYKHQLETLLNLSTEWN